MKNKYYLSIIILVSILGGNFVVAQTDTISANKLRTESGVDPTRVKSRVGFSVQYFDKSDNKSSVINKLNLTIGVNKWSFSLKTQIIAKHDGVQGTGFNTGFADLNFSILNAFYAKGKNSIAGAVEFNLPFGKQDFGSQYFSATPSITYAYTINTSLFLAIQPQYSFAIARDELYPDLSILTIRNFIAKFTEKGVFYVFEPRIIFDFESNHFDLILSPIIG